MDAVERTNEALREAAPTLWECLSPLGRRVAFPPDIPFQAAEARGTRYNATIGQITDGDGRALALPPIEDALSGLPPEERNQALLYSPVQGLPAVREAWRRWQRREVPDHLPSSLPLVTCGLTHGLSVAADLFAGPGRAVLITTPFWGNYRQTFEVRTGARVRTAAAYLAGRFHPRALAELAAEEPEGEPVVALVNFPSNPGGYMPTREEREELVESLVEAAERRPLVVLCDDAYAGLVYEEGVPSGSLFWDFVGRHERLVPVKIDGATKEFSLFGGRVGFLTFACEPDGPAAQALESKVKCLVRSTVGSPVATSQVLLLEALGRPGGERHVEVLRERLARRWVRLRRALGELDPEMIAALPCNAGCFALLELPEGVDPGEARRHLIAEHGTGVGASPPPSAHRVLLGP
ncbi:MAG: aminotransferase class I/II-fold pyridoxal phosphate-dependent enzyme [Thermoanaerobaculia bacterium]